MVITPALTENGDWRYRIKYDDGAVEENAVSIPESFGPCATGTVFDKKIQLSEYVLLLESQLQIAVNDATEFMRMVESPEFNHRLSVLSGSVRQTFVLTILQRAEEVFDLRDPISASHPIARFINNNCKQWLFEHWRSDISPDGRMYNFAGVFAQLEALGQESPTTQYNFLERIIAEISEPMTCEFYDHKGGEDDRNPFITVLYPHSFTYGELEFLNEKLAMLRRECAVKDAHDPALNDIPSPAWNGMLTELVFIFDALKESGYLSATDACIMAHINIKSGAKDRAKVYRDTRKKLREGMAYPDRARLEQLIELLRKGIE